jgi:hypothetical protein
LTSQSPTVRGGVDPRQPDDASERNWKLPTISAVSRDRLPNPIHDRDDRRYIPRNRPAIGDLMNLLTFADRDGRVEFLVEACDPSEAAEFGYTIDNLLVSDFYTPRYFDPVQSDSVRYSFTGRSHLAANNDGML